ncbi:MAG: LiaI-LiaF-like domain-containing protein [Patescibacteria group bacterium]|jgi:hypothetical protein
MTSSTQESPVARTPQRQTSGANVVGALILIALGTIFLLSNFGYLPWTVWLTLWRLWPILLILFGLQLLLGRSLVARWVTALISLLILTSALLYAVANVHAPARTWIRDSLGITVRNIEELGERVTSTQSVPSERYADATSRTLRADVGAAALHISESTKPTILDVDATHPKGAGVPVLTDSQRNGTVHLEFSTRNPARGWMLNPVERSYELTFGTPKLPTALSIDLGAGKTTVRITETPLSDLDLEVGAGSAELTLGTIALPSTMKLDVGAGNITLSVPRETKLTVKHDVGAGRMVVDGETLSRTGQYVADGTGKAVVVTAHAGAGTITIERK